MDNSVIIRRVEARDWLAVTTLLAELGRPARDPATEAQARAVFEAYVADPRTGSLLAERDNHAVGVITMELRPRLNYPTPELYVPDLIVTERERGTGIASALFAGAVAFAREHGCHQLTLDSGYHRQRAHSFYRREGMTDAGKFFTLSLRDQA
jgi:GNAT superfamily N-acetyltransferase